MSHLRVALAIQLAVLAPGAFAEQITMGTYTVDVGEGGTKSIDKITSAVVEVPGTPEEIAKKGQSCIARLVQNASAPAKSQGMAAAIFGRKDDSGEAAGPVIESADTAGGVIIANNRVGFSSGMLNMVVKSRLVFESKEGRFRITQSDIAGRVPGSKYGDGYQAVVKVWGSGWEPAVNALTAVSDAVVECVKKTEAEDAW